MSVEGAEKITEQPEQIEDVKKEDTKQQGGGKGSKGNGGGYRLNVKNFTKETAETAEKLKALFEPFGAVTDSQVKIREDGKFLGLGFVVFASEPEAKTAIAELHEKEFDGKKLAVFLAERRVDDSNQNYNQWSAYTPKGKGKDKDKGKVAMQQFAAMQTAYAAAYSQMYSASMGTAGTPIEEKRGSVDSGKRGSTDSSVSVATAEQIAPGEYTGSLKFRMRYGQKKSYLVSPITFQYYGSDVYVDKEFIPNGAKDGDVMKFTVAVAYGEAKWDDKLGWTTPYAKGYPKAKTVRLVSSASKVE